MRNLKMVAREDEIPAPPKKKKLMADAMPKKSAPKPPSKAKKVVAHRKTKRIFLQLSRRKVALPVPLLQRKKKRMHPFSESSDQICHCTMLLIQ